MRKTYTELVKLPTFLERYRYLKLNGKVGEETFGAERYFNQIFYRSPLWRAVRRDVIIRDSGCDLGIADRLIGGVIYVHHLEPVTIEDIENRRPWILNPEYLICASSNTHRAIHYGDESLLIPEYKERTPNDTVPWR